MSNAAQITRRHVLAGTAGLGGALLLAGAGRQSALGQDATPEPVHADHQGGDMTDPSVDQLITGPGPWQPDDLVEPEERRSAGGVLETQLRVQHAYNDIGGYRLYLRNYEGKIPGPTLRVQPGDTLRIRLINDLPPNREGPLLYQDLPQLLNTTNFHAHGMHVSPAGISDNIFRMMEPGESYDIEIAIPGNHPSGSYWYHPHHHGAADVQIASGMAGMLIVEGDFADVPEIAEAREHVLVLSHVVFDAYHTIEGFETVWPDAGLRFFSVNGQREPIIRMRPGEVQRWRILHTGYQNDILLSLEGHTLLPIARDGISLPAIGSSLEIRQPARSDAGDPEAILFAPAHRVDVLVQAGGPGTYLLQALPRFESYAAPIGPIAHVIVEGEPLPMQLPTSLPPAPLATIRDEELTGTRELTFSRLAPEAGEAGHWREFAFFIDDKLFDHDRVDQVVNLGAVEEWTLTNVDDYNDHVFHIHTNPFQLTQVNGKPVEEPIWLDTVHVPHSGSVTIRSRFLDFTGKYVLHCHMMNHEELGMMQVVEVV
jgi:FtsP/CotA-like multicopper oxidase with cupredoxin domain